MMLFVSLLLFYTTAFALTLENQASILKELDTENSELSDKISKRGWEDWDMPVKRGWEAWDTPGKRGWEAWDEPGKRVPQPFGRRDKKGWEAWDIPGKRGWEAWDTPGKRGWETWDHPSKKSLETLDLKTKRGWEVWDEYPWIKSAIVANKRAWKAFGINLDSGLINRRTLSALKRELGGLNPTSVQQKHSPSKEVLDNGSDIIRINADNCKCCKVDKNPFCCLLCSIANAYFLTGNAENGNILPEKTFCSCCSLLSDADCCRFCDILKD